MADSAAAQTERIPGLNDHENQKAAELIQAANVSGTSRPTAVGWLRSGCGIQMVRMKDAQFQSLTSPVAPNSKQSDETPSPQSPRPAISKWNHATSIARRAGADDLSVSESLSDADSDSFANQIRVQKEEKAQATADRKRTAKMMDLQYFLEMVDQKHRYGSNLRKYHAHWRLADTRQSFFYWLDHGDAKALSLPECSRARLDEMQVRYLSREERMKYLVQIDHRGRLVWAKNGERVWTKDELYKDSIDGIVPITDVAPKFRYNVKPEDESSSDESDAEANVAGDEGEQYVNEDFHRARGPAKLKHVSAGVMFNHMIRKSLRKGHKWIFVADTSFRLYIGYKQSGAFQHSSFLHGARITSAGLIKVKDGQLRSLAPLSGHYRPPATNFRSFVHALKAEGADMSRVSISKSYAVLVGMEGYTKGKTRVKAAEEAVSHQTNKVLRPQKAKEVEDESRDQTESAEKERIFLEQQRSSRERARKQARFPQRVNARLSRTIQRLTGKKHAFVDDRGVAGTGPEDGVPRPSTQ